MYTSLTITIAFLLNILSVIHIKCKTVSVVWIYNQLEIFLTHINLSIVEGC